MRLHCPPDTGFEIRDLARYLSPQYLILLYEWARKKHFGFFKLVGQSGVWTRDLRLSKQAALTVNSTWKPQKMSNIFYWAHFHYYIAWITYQINKVYKKNNVGLIRIDVTVDKSLSFNNHISNVINKCNRVNGMIRRSLGYRSPASVSINLSLQSPNPAYYRILCPSMVTLYQNSNRVHWTNSTKCY